MKAVHWQDGRVLLLDQTRLPGEEIYLEIADYQEMALAIKEMRVRGAPAIGLAAAYGLALGVLKSRARSREGFLKELGEVKKALAATRPTAVNLFWALNRLEKVAISKDGVEEMKSALVKEAQKMEKEDEAANRTLGKLGAALIPDGATVLTHCNAGALATGGYGTALGVIRAAWEQGKQLRVYATETRPLLQGSRLTTWELVREGIPVTLITDSMAGFFMSQKKITCAIVGADRVAANGDVANKIGTYTLAVLAKENGIPFYVAAPTSTFDPSLPSGEAIPIEERKPEEVTHFQGKRIAPEGVTAANPAFDVTPHRYISAIITEKGVFQQPYQENLKDLKES